MKDFPNDFVDRIQEWLDDGEIIREGLSYEGAVLVRRLVAEQSLRSLAKDCGLSPTYLSGVLNGRIIISPKSFIALAKMEKRR